MSMPVESGAMIVAAKETQIEAGSYVDWPAIIVGAIVASAISLVFLTFGSAIGLTFTSPFDGAGGSAVGLAIGLALWLVWVQVSGFMAGGYVTGRLRRRMFDATEHESDVRDGMHGLAVWATGVVIGGVLLASGIGGVVGAAANATGGAVQTAVEKLGDPSDTANPLNYVAGTAFRSTQAAPADLAPARAETVAILGKSVAGGGDVSEDDRAYLAQLISRDTGISPEEAQARVDILVADAQAVSDKAKAAADKARRFAVVAAFIAAASLAVSAAAAYWAAGMGGRHRDEATMIPFWFDRIK